MVEWSDCKWTGNMVLLSVMKQASNRMVCFAWRKFLGDSLGIPHQRVVPSYRPVLMRTLASYQRNFEHLSCELGLSLMKFERASLFQAENSRSESEGGSCNRSNSRSLSSSPVIHFKRSLKLFFLMVVQISFILLSGSLRWLHSYPFSLHGEHGLSGLLSSLSH